MSERCWPVLMAGKKHLNWSEVTPPLYVLWNHFSISTQSFSSTSGLARYIEYNVKLSLSHHPSPIYNEHPVIKSQACFVQKFLADFDPTTIIIWSIKHYIGVFPLTSAALQVLTLDQFHHHGHSLRDSGWRFCPDENHMGGNLWNSLNYMILDPSTVEHVYTVDNLLTF